MPVIRTRSPAAASFTSSGWKTSMPSSPAVSATGGGARSVLWRQLQADIYGTPIRRTVADEGPAYGAALLAGVASGTYTSVDEAVSVVKLREEITEPDLERSKVYEDYYEVYRSLYPATSSAMSRLTDLAAGSTGE